MSCKAAVIFGDYANGWNDAVIVQTVLPFKLESHRTAASQTLLTGIAAAHMAVIAQEVERNETLCPLPKDEPCCKDFKEWAAECTSKTAKLCPFCGKAITEERRAKFFTSSL